MQEYHLKKLKILVVEDNLVNQKVLRIILDRNDCQYEIANDGAEAIQMFEKGKYNLILMDCQMPVLNGLQASQKIRELEQSKMVPRCRIVAMTANAMMGDREKCISAGMDDFLSKPFKSQDLLEMLKAWGEKCIA
jgi:CheY-like chemotaxis protein